MSGCSARAVWAGDCLERQAEWVVLTAWVIAGAGHRDLAGLVTAASGGRLGDCRRVYRSRMCDPLVRGKTAAELSSAAAARASGSAIPWCRCR